MEGRDRKFVRRVRKRSFWDLSRAGSRPASREDRLESRLVDFFSPRESSGHSSNRYEKRMSFRAASSSSSSSGEGWGFGTHGRVFGVGSEEK